MYPVLVISYSFFGLIIMLGVSEALTYLLHWLGNNKEGMNDAKEGFYMTIAPFYLPFLLFSILYHLYIRTVCSLP